MKFGMNPSPYYRSKRSTTQIMLELFIGLCLIWICGIVYYFIQSPANGVAAIVSPVVAMVTALVTECLFMLPKHIKEKGTFKSLISKLINSYGYITGIILALLLPVGTSIYAIIISTIFAIAVGKMLFGGFGHNIFNPAILGRIFAQTAFLTQMKYDVDSSLAISTGATVTTTLGNSGWSLEMLELNNYSLLDLLLGNYRGTLGETFTLVILVVGVVLALRKVIDWRAPTFYLGAMFISFFFMGLTGGYELDSFEYALVQISIGGIMFGAVFCITDPVTTPTSKAGRIIYGLGAALVTMLIRCLGSAPEGVAYSILIMNALTPLIDSSIKGLSTQFTRRKIITTCVMGAITIGAGAVIGVNEVEKAYFLNYINQNRNESFDIQSNVKRISTNGNFITYNSVVSGVLGENEDFTIGNINDLYTLSDYQKYFNETDKYSNVKYKLENSTYNLQISYKDIATGEITTEYVLVSEQKLSLKPTLNEDGYWYVGGYKTQYTGEQYSLVYGASIEENALVVTFATDHKAADENNQAFINVEFNVTVNIKDRMITGTEFVGTGGTDGWGNTLLTNGADRGSYDHAAGYGTNLAKAAEFYNKYVLVESPISFDEVLKTSYTSFGDVTEIKANTEGLTILAGITYTSLGYVTLLQRVVEYAIADNTAGKVDL